MKKLLLAILIAAYAPVLIAQSGGLASADTTANRTKVIVGNVVEHRNDPANNSDINQVTISLWKYTAADTHPDPNGDITIIITTVATINAFETARGAIVPGENASGVAQQNFRVLTWGKANTGTSGVTIQCNDKTLTQAQCILQVSTMTVGTT